ncbi:hypothetical protein [Nannocystis radixulma]|uniref:DUF998 domain-containing protein n=1 Tax=Nannocystis radixulma TaxID=2995305 RepID=A0ABT5BNE4_9BACT|nr:hypothetical protein [Nannocystis radixulma]MDC0675029.1 hypothetical protein [Nannocystis radixulma]
MIGPSFLLAVALASPADAPADSAEGAGAVVPAPAATADVTGADGAIARAPTTSPTARAKTGRGMLIAGGVLTGLGVVGRIGLEVFWSTAAQIVPTDPFGRWSTANLAFVTNWNNLMFFGPGLGLLTAGAYRRGGHEARLGKVRDAKRMRLVGIGLLSGGLGLWALSRALFLPIADACPSNRCAYTTLETTFWIGTGAIFAGAAHLAYGTGYSKAAAKVSVAPSLGPGFAGLGLAGRF